MGDDRGKAERAKPGARLTPQQQKRFATVRANLVAETGRSLEDWAEILKTCPETGRRGQVAWLKAAHRLGQNRAMQVIDAAFPEAAGWDDPDALLSALWKEPAGRAIYDAVAATISAWTGVIVGPRKTFVGFSKAVQFAAIKPVKGAAALGLPLAPDAAAPRGEPQGAIVGAQHRDAAVDLRRGVGRGGHCARAPVLRGGKVARARAALDRGGSCRSLDQSSSRLTSGDCLNGVC